MKAYSLFTSGDFQHAQTFEYRRMRRVVDTSSGSFHKGWFHETTNHTDESEKTANDKKKLIGVTDLIGRPTNAVWSVH